GVAIDIQTHNAAIGMLAAILTGGVMAGIHAFSAIRLRADQIISGMAINLLALGLTSYLLFSVYGSANVPPACVPPVPCSGDQVRTIPDWSIPVLHKIPGLGPILFHQNPIVYLMLLLVVAVHLFLFRTTLGLRIRAVGEHPRAADTAGINVEALRYLSVLLSGVLSGLAGGFLALSLGSFSDNMTSGRGFIALAAMIFGKWTPFGAFGACLLFGFGEALYNTLQLTPGPVQDYSTLVGALPYVLTIVALAGFIGRAIAPAADGVPYDPASGG
ncbi:MAG: ABC transporter permease, partial [Chloroflexota bacterium]